MSSYTRDILVIVAVAVFFGCVICFAEPPVSLPRPAATQPAGPLHIEKVECVLYVTWSDGQTTRRVIESHVGH
jgi:hypothetical protein